MNKPPVLILGGRSDVGLATAHQFAALGHPIQLAVRNTENLQSEQKNMALRFNISVTLHEFDILNFLDNDSCQQFIDSLPILPQIVVCAVGRLGDQVLEQQQLATAIQTLRCNFEGPAILFEAFAQQFEQRGSGTLIGISSVAGNRGRATNYIYGSAKAGFTAYLSGLRNRLTTANVHVITVLPGFIATKMTEHLTLPEKLTAQPEEVAKAIVKAQQKQRNIIYVKPIWQFVMLAIQHIPEMIFKKMKI